tara:strand:+ start:560 stop:1567 length:1008 start_codon:yes stop_codon:yes gene_type:complete
MEKAIIIAEAGVNHNGDVRIAKELVKNAFEAGADYVKFQVFKADSIVTRDAKQAEYQKKNTKTKESQYDMLKKLELKDEDYHEIYQQCISCGIGFLSSAFDIEAINFLKKFNMDYLKIPSGEITNLPYLKHAAQFGKPIILSTGMASFDDIGLAIEVINEYGCPKKNITVLHCLSEYPAPINLVNLRFMKTIKNEFGVSVGYSDHTLGIEVSIASVALGAKIIEKHFTLNKNMLGPDHFASLEPKELKAMIKAIRNIEKSLGNGIKDISVIEKENSKVVRKSLVAIQEIKKGELFSNINIGCKRPGTGISPMLINQIIGKVSNRNYKVDQIIENY